MRKHFLHSHLISLEIIDILANPDLADQYAAQSVPQVFANEKQIGLGALIGIGGGVVAVPVLIEAFDFMGLDDGTGLALSIGTAQASIVVASLTAAAAHWRASTLCRRWPSRSQ